MFIEAKLNNAELLYLFGEQLFIFEANRNYIEVI